MNKILYINKRVISFHVYQTWSTKELPPYMKKTIDHNKELNPDFIFHLYDDNDCRNFIKNNYNSDVLTAYDGLKPGAYKADLWRYCILYMYGGIYMDVKIKLLFNFSLTELVYSEHYVKDIAGPFDKIGIYNAFMVHEPRSPILFKLIEQIVINVKNKYYGANPLSITGPELFGNIYEKMGLNNLNIIHTPSGKLSFKNKIIAVMYPQYREEQKMNGQIVNGQIINSQIVNIQHYSEMWKLKKVY